jgi:hypothetical protein
VSPVSLDSADTADLAAQVAGPVLLPHDAGYHAERSSFNLLTQLRPAVAVGATTADSRMDTRYLDPSRRFIRVEGGTGGSRYST